MKGLGPANDNDPNVIDEIDAARWDGQWRDAMPMRFHRGYSAHFLGRDISVDERPGWLLREMDTHDSIGIAKRDADSWPWDPSRPVAGQYEEWRVHMDRGDAMLEEAMADQLEAAQAEIATLAGHVTGAMGTVGQLVEERDDLLEALRGEMRALQSATSRENSAMRERDKLRLQLEAKDAIIAAGQRTIDSGNEAFRTLREQWQGERDKLQSELEAARREVEMYKHQIESVASYARACDSFGPEDGGNYTYLAVAKELHRLTSDAYRAARDRAGG